VKIFGGEKLQTSQHVSTSNVILAGEHTAVRRLKLRIAISAPNARRSASCCLKSHWSRYCDSDSHRKHRGRRDGLSAIFLGTRSELHSSRRSFPALTLTPSHRHLHEQLHPPYPIFSELLFPPLDHRNVSARHSRKPYDSGKMAEAMEGVVTEKEQGSSAGKTALGELPSLQ